MAKKLVFDRVLFATVVLLTGLGLVMVYSASAAISRARGHAVNPFLVKQAVAALVGFVGMAIAMHVDYRRFKEPRVVYALLGGVLALLVAVLLAPELNSTRRWFFVGGGFAFYLMQGRDTIVAFTRVTAPEPRTVVTVTGQVSTGFLDGVPRQALFEDPPKPAEKK